MSPSVGFVLKGKSLSIDDTLFLLTKPKVSRPCRADTPGRISDPPNRGLVRLVPSTFPNSVEEKSALAEHEGQ